IGGVTQETYFWQGLRNNLNGVDPRTLAYPAYHYGMVLCSVRAAIGDNLSIRVRNDGGGLSNTLTYTVPALAELDSDGDSLLDDWEENGYDADGDGTIDVDLPAMGANPHHFDIFVEVDWMNGRAPTAAAWPVVEQTFADAPLLNVLYGSGIHIHIDRGQSTYTDLEGNVQTIPAAERQGGQTLPFSDFIRMDGSASPLADPGETTANFYTLKGSNFSSNRADIFRYGIFAQFHGHSNCSSGRGEIWGNDLMITRTCSSDYFSNTNQLAGTFLHEFGHNLNFRHGGGSDGDNTNNEPNYLSVMNYLFQFPGVDNNCDQNPDGIFTYSQGLHNNLNESNLSEPNGICGNVAIDWNSNGNATQTGLNFDINGDGSITTLTDFDNWGNLFFNFRDAPDFND
ncbi:MAG: hypothetical protein KDC44_05845, partial [Phaeodactylibacter sp.]|nr:hypothetical protein [Phaeodactylibacter sp.]